MSSPDDSILTSIKKTLNIAPDYKAFDQELILFINSSFLALRQLGVGPEDGFIITDETQTWKQLIQGDRLEAAKTYIHAQVRLLFDPPTSSFGQESLRKISDELGWRLFVESEHND